jgi:CubicO group peptidase (beta-lactamase class C family)
VGPKYRSNAEVRDALYEAAKTTTEKTGCAAQVALAQHGELAVFGSFGSAAHGDGSREAREVDEETLFVLFSVTKAIVAAASWILLQENRLSLEDRVADHVPGFGVAGKERISIEDLLIHTAGLPNARLDTRDWLDPAVRRQRFAEWELEWTPGSRFSYHGNSSMWLLAEVIGAVSGTDYRDFIRSRIIEPLGLSDLYIGLPDDEQGRVARVEVVGEPMSDQKRSVSPVDAPTIEDTMVTWANHEEMRRIGNPGGGAIGTAADVARFYQAVLADLAGDGPGIWQQGMVEEAITPRCVELIDPMTSQPALRGLGVVVAGEDGRMWRGFGTDCSARAFGHMGAGGQVAWADPETGIAFAYCTNGAERNAAKQGARGLRLSNLAASYA